MTIIFDVHVGDQSLALELLVQARDDDLNKNAELTFFLMQPDQIDFTITTARDSRGGMVRATYIYHLQ